MSYRNLDINGRAFRWKIGSRHLDIRDPDGKGYRPKIDEVQDPVEAKACADWYEPVPITPRDVKRWIIQKGI